MPMLVNSYNYVSAAAPGQQVFTADGSFVVPDGVTSLAALALGAYGNVTSAGGGGLSYNNAIAVTPGETLTVTVGSAGSVIHASIYRGGTPLLIARTANLNVGGAADTTGGATSYAGGSGGSGIGGDAGNWTANGLNAGAGAAGLGRSLLGSSPGGGNTYGGKNATGGPSAIRIMWGGSRSYPSNAGNL